MTVVHDEFRGMGLSGVGEFLGAGAVVVDVRGCSRRERFEGVLLGDCGGKGICILTASMGKGDRNHGEWKSRNIQRRRKINGERCRYAAISRL